MQKVKCSAYYSVVVFIFHITLANVLWSIYFLGWSIVNFTEGASAGILQNCTVNRYCRLTVFCMIMRYFPWRVGAIRSCTYSQFAQRDFMVIKDNHLNFRFGSRGGGWNRWGEGAI